LQADRATRRVGRNLVDCCTVVRSEAIQLERYGRRTCSKLRAQRMYISHRLDRRRVLLATRSWSVRRQTHGYLPSRTALLLYLGRYPFLVPPRVAHMLFISAYTWHIGLRVLYASSPADIAAVLSYIRGTRQLRYRLACRGSRQSCLTNEKCMSHSFMLC